MISNRKKIVVAIILGVVFLGILLLYFFYNPSNSNHFPQCPFLTATGYYCTGCGSQRALHDLLHLDIMGVAKHNLLFIPAFLLIAYHWVRSYAPLKGKESLPDLIYHPKTPIVLFIIITLFTILRNIHLYPFTLLAPE
ncbi:MULTISPECIES: DUF2752 domain-containing protein [Arenibacter]|uniref:DUF2752 domain-containing protein n=1 Tax=Arenibacter TaxID=178469 RepID=UPI001C067526|nr:DUF2752 domain-containing protein [Arenibacter algicola]MCK0134551.1 DUF2752 domain-containing protein [Arenibacter sp. S6351L]